jgi:hypothetical protein
VLKPIRCALPPRKSDGQSASLAAGEDLEGAIDAIGVIFIISLGGAPLPTYLASMRDARNSLLSGPVPAPHAARRGFRSFGLFEGNI